MSVALAPTLETFLLQRGMPRGPLCTLRCSATEFEGLRETWRSTPAGAQGQEKLFVLLAAEAIRRTYEGGPWTWDLVRRALGTSASHQEFMAWTERGLAGWGRPLRQQGGTRRYLVSLVCEGGLSTWLITQEGRRLREWCRSILRDLQAFGLSGDEAEAELGAVARRRVSGMGASYYRDEAVHLLFGLLLGRIWSLRRHQGAFPTRNIPAWLDARDPGWRERLPLDLADVDAQRLLADLLAEAEEVTRPPVRPVVRTWMVGEELVRELHLPALLHRDVLIALFGDRRFPRRMQVATVGPQGRSLCTLLEEREGYRSSQSGTQVVGRGPDPVRVVLEGGFSLPAEGLAGTAALPDLPWVFAALGERWRLVGMGACSHGDAALRVALPEGWTLEGEEVGTCAERRVVELRGPGVARSPSGEHLSIRPGGPGQEDDLAELSFTGRRLPWSPPDQIVWSGLPGVRQVLESGVRDVRPEQLRVRLQDGRWGGWEQVRAGRVDVRLVRAEQVKAEARFWWAPADLEVEEDVEADGGTVWVRSAHVLQLGVRGSPVGYVHSPCARGGRRGLSLRVTQRPPARVAIFAALENNQELDLAVPFPLARDAFLDALDREVTGAVDLGQARHMVAESRFPGHGGRPVVYAQVLNRSGAPVDERIFHLPLAMGGVYRMPLRDIHEDLVELMATVDELDAHLDLRIEHLGVAARHTPPLEVRRYNARLEPVKGDDIVRLTGQALADDVDLRVEVARFDALTRTYPLRPLRPGLRWLFEAAEREPGPWLVTIVDDGGPLARPVAWRVEGEFSPTGALARSCRLRDGLRLPAMRAVLGGMAREEGEEVDWETLRDHVGAIARMDATALDILRLLPDYPELVARFALEAPDEESLERFWRAMNQLPFLWEIVSDRSWEAALDALHRHLEPLFAVNVELGWKALHDSIKRVGLRLPTLGRVWWPWWGRRAGSKAVAERPAEALIFQEHLQFAQERRRADVEELLQRHAGEQWPTLPGGRTNLSELFRGIRLDADWIRGQPAYQHPVLLAPALCALIARTGQRLSRDQIRLLRELRAFDRSFFSDTYLTW